MRPLAGDAGAYRLTADAAVVDDRRRRRELELLRETAREFAEEPDARAFAAVVAARAGAMAEATRAMVVWVEASEPAIVAFWPPGGQEPAPDLSVPTPPPAG